MHHQQSQLHYAPVSVGGLMDPGFLREAVQDSEGRMRSKSAPGRLQAGWRAAVLATTRMWLAARTPAAPSGDGS